VTEYLAGSRPTGGQSVLGLRRVTQRALALRGQQSPRAIHAALLSEARAIHEESRAMCHAIGRHGAELLPDGAGVLTHCKPPGGWRPPSTARRCRHLLRPQDQASRLHVYCRRDAARCWQRVASHRLGTAAARGGHDVDLRLDGGPSDAGGAGSRRSSTGADRIAANGDTAKQDLALNGAAVLGPRHKIPFLRPPPQPTPST